MSDEEGWAYSHEGELDPDLTEEAGYAGWESPRRTWWPLVLRVGIVFLIGSMIVPLVLSAAH